MAISALGFSHVNPEFILNLISELSITQLLVLVVTGSIMIGKVRLEGWREKMPVYIIKCPKHGYQITYPQGYMSNLACPKCVSE